MTETPTALQRTPGLSDRMADALASEIVAGRFGPGERLPAEQVLGVRFGVSRTVVREAMSRLKSEGLVTSRQGAGAFVAQRAPVRPFRIDTASTDSVQSIIFLAELRMGVESQSAALAAVRASEAQLREMKRALSDMERAIERSEDGVEADVRFHRAVADATGNPHVRSFLEFVGRHLGESIRVSRLNTAQYPGRARYVLAEHRAIYEAIRARDAAAARDKAAQHLANTITRLEAAYAGTTAEAARQPAKRRNKRRQEEA